MTPIVKYEQSRALVKVVRTDFISKKYCYREKESNVN